MIFGYGTCNDGLMLRRGDGERDAREAEDEEVLARSIREPSSFIVLVERYQQPFLKAALGVVRSREEAEDVVQETFTKIYLHAGRFKKQEGARFKSWGYKILLNTAFTHYQKVKRIGGKTEYLDAVHYDEDGVGVLAEHHDLASQSDARVLVAETISRMPEHLGRLLILYYIEDRSYQDIATIERISMSTLKMRLFRAKKLFRKMSIECEGGYLQSV